MVFSWFILFIVLIVIELATVNLVTVWFAIGALAALIVSIFNDSIAVQAIVFVVTSIASLLITKPLVSKLKGQTPIPTNSDMVIGKKGVVTEEILPDKYGEVKVFGNRWTAKSSEELSVGDKIKVINIEGAKVIVRRDD